jgi:mediator of RNA polymerase II transcription subunit 7
MMQDQLDRSRKETEGIREMKAKVESIIEGLAQAKLAEGEVADAGKDAKKVENGKDVWDELEKVFS